MTLSIPSTCYEETLRSVRFPPDPEYGQGNDPACSNLGSFQGSTRRRVPERESYLHTKLASGRDTVHLTRNDVSDGKCVCSCLRLHSRL